MDIKKLAIASGADFGRNTLEALSYLNSEEEDMEYLILLRKIIDDYFDVVMYDKETQLPQILGEK